MLAGVAEVLDDGEQVVPAAGVETGGVLPQLVEDLVHLEGGGDGLDQHGGADGAVRDAQLGLGVSEDVVPEPGFQVALGLRQVEVRPGVRVVGASGEQPGGVVEEVEAEVEERAGHRLAVDQQMVLVEVPAAGTDHDGGEFGGRPEGVRLARVGGEVDPALEGVDQVDLTAHHVLPGRGGGVLEVGEPDLRAGVQRVDHHLAVGGAGDLDPAVLERPGRLGDPPVGGADPGRVGQEVQGSGAGDLRPALPAAGQQFAAPALEGAVQADDEGDRLRSEHLLGPVDARTRDRDDRSGGGSSGSLICSHEQDTPKWRA